MRLWNGYYIEINNFVLLPLYPIIYKKKNESAGKTAANDKIKLFFLFFLMIEKLDIEFCFYVIENEKKFVGVCHFDASVVHTVSHKFFSSRYFISFSFRLGYNFDKYF